jgi:ribokinase
MDIVATVARHPVPGETISGSTLSYYPGGKGANQAIASARAGGRVEMLGFVGNDAFAPQLLAFLDNNSVDTTNVVQLPEGSSGTALIVVDAEGENSIVVIPGANAAPTPDYIRKHAHVESGDVLIAQFETPVSATTEFFSIGKQNNATCILNPAPAADIPRQLIGLVDVLVLNETELSLLTSSTITDHASAELIRQSLATLQLLGFAGTLVITLGAEGAISVTSTGDIAAFAGRPVAAIDTTGAGDCFVGYLASGLAAGRPLDDSMALANVAASLCVQRRGAGPSMPEYREVEQLVTASSEQR